MTRFVDVPTMSTLITSTGLAPFISDLVECVREDYCRWHEFEHSPRLAAHSDIGVIELMPAWDAKRYGVKYVNGHPGNPSKGLYTVMAFGILAEQETGYPVLLSELTLSTALRTCATSVVAAQALARPDSQRMAVIGAGAQSEFQIIAFHTIMGISDFVVFDLDSRAVEKLQRNLREFPNIMLTVTPSTADAVRGADIVTTITADKALATIITPDMVEPGMHFNAVGGDCPGKTELHADVLRKSRVVVEYEPQTRVEGDIQQLPQDFPVTELWQILTHEVPGRTSAAEVTVFDSVGFGLEDFSVLRLIYREATARNIGVDIELVPVPDNPKDLFTLTKDGRLKLVRTQAS